MNAADHFDARYHRRWRHARWPDVLAALIIVVVVVVVFAESVRQFYFGRAAVAQGMYLYYGSLDNALETVRRILMLSGLAGAFVPVAWLWCRLLPPMGRLVDGAFRHDMALTPTQPGEVLWTEMAPRGLWALLPAATWTAVLLGLFGWEMSGRIHSRSDVAEMTTVLSLWMALLALMVLWALVGVTWAGLGQLRRGRMAWLGLGLVQFIVGLVASAIAMGLMVALGLVVVGTTDAWMRDTHSRAGSVALALIVCVIGGVLPVAAVGGGVRLLLSNWRALRSEFAWLDLERRPLDLEQAPGAPSTCVDFAARRRILELPLVVLGALLVLPVVIWLACGLDEASSAAALGCNFAAVVPLLASALCLTRLQLAELRLANPVPKAREAALRLARAQVWWLAALAFVVWCVPVALMVREFADPAVRWRVPWTLAILPWLFGGPAVLLGIGVVMIDAAIALRCPSRRVSRWDLFRRTLAMVVIVAMGAAIVGSASLVPRLVTHDSSRIWMYRESGDALVTMIASGLLQGLLLVGAVLCVRHWMQVWRRTAAQRARPDLHDR